MKRAFLLGSLAAAAVALGAGPSQAASAPEPCQPASAAEAPCLKTPPCAPTPAPCHT